MIQLRTSDDTSIRRSRATEPSWPKRTLANTGYIMINRPMKIGSEVPEVTWMAFRCVPRLGMTRPKPIPIAMATMIHTGRKRSRNESRAPTGLSISVPTVNCSETTLLTAQPRAPRPGSAARVGRRSATGEVGPACAACRSARIRGSELPVGHVRVRQDRVDLPRLPAGSVDPHFVLEGVAAFRLLLDGRGQSASGQTDLRGGHLVGRRDLDTEVVERARHFGGILDEDQLERWVGYGKIGVAGADFGRLGGEQLGIEHDSFVKISDVQGKLDTGHARTSW